MRGPKPVTITLSAAERHALVQLVRRYSTPQQIVVRARIVLAAAEGMNNGQIARHLQVSIDTVRLWRQRWVSLQPVTLDDLPLLDRLTDAPRPGKPVRITDEQVCQIIALACDAPEQAGRPISQWTGREIAEEIIRRGIVAQISGRHAARLLKRGRSSHTAGGTG